MGPGDTFRPLSRFSEALTSAFIITSYLLQWYSPLYFLPFLCLSLQMEQSLEEFSSDSKLTLNIYSSAVILYLSARYAYWKKLCIFWFASSPLSLPSLKLLRSPSLTGVHGYLDDSDSSRRHTTLLDTRSGTHCLGRLGIWNHDSSICHLFARLHENVLRV